MEKGLARSQQYMRFYWRFCFLRVFVDRDSLLGGFDGREETGRVISNAFPLADIHLYAFSLAEKGAASP